MTELDVSLSITQLSVVPPPVGGVSVFVDRLHKRLLACGIESYVAVPKWWTGSPRKDVFRRSGFGGRLGHFDALWHLTKPFTTKIVHCHEGYRDNAPVLMMLKAQGKKIVLTIHSPYHCGDLGDLYPWQRYCARRILQDDQIYWIAVSQQIKTKLIKLGVAGPIAVIPAYLPSQANQVNLPENIRSFIDTYARPILVYGFRFSRLGGKDLYGFDVAIRMIHDLLPYHADVGLIVLCPDPESNDGQRRLSILRQLSIDLAVAERICWVLQPLDSLGSLLKRCAVYVRPTLSDGDSLLVREALQQEVPVVASDVVTRPEGVITYSLGDSVAGLLRGVNAALVQNGPTPHQQPETFDMMLTIYKRILGD